MINELHLAMVNCKIMYEDGLYDLRCEIFRMLTIKKLKPAIYLNIADVFDVDANISFAYYISFYVM